MIKVRKTSNKKRDKNMKRMEIEEQRNYKIPKNMDEYKYPSQYFFKANEKERMKETTVRIRTKYHIVKVIFRIEDNDFSITGDIKDTRPEYRTFEMFGALGGIIYNIPQFERFKGMHLRNIFTGDGMHGPSNEHYILSGRHDHFTIDENYADEMFTTLDDLLSISKKIAENKMTEYDFGNEWYIPRLPMLKKKAEETFKEFMRIRDDKKYREETFKDLPDFDLTPFIIADEPKDGDKVILFDRKTCKVELATVKRDEV